MSCFRWSCNLYLTRKASVTLKKQFFMIDCNKSELQIKQHKIKKNSSYGTKSVSNTNAIMKS